MKVNLKRQQVLVDAAKAHSASTAASNSTGTSSGENANENSSDFLLTEEIAMNYNAITVDSIPLEINPNIFLARYQPSGLDAEAESAIRNDESLACELGSYLYQTILPAVTQQIRMLDTIVYDNQQLVEYLHNQGVNLRYLGRLARLASDQEAEDTRILSEQKQRIHAMPTYWLELLEIEIIARGMKHLYRKYLLKNPKFRSAPGFTLISLLNHLLGSTSTSNGATTEVSSSTTVQVANPAPVPVPPSKSAKKRMKAKAQAAIVSKVSGAITAWTEVIDGTSNSETTISDLNQIIKERFLYKLSLANHGVEDSFLGPRIHRYTLLRRICQLNGIRLNNRDYDFASSTPFAIDDLVALVPILKTCEPDIPITDIRNLIYNSRIAMQESNLQLAFELCQEASHWIQQAVGPIHKESLLALDQLTAIFITANDLISALSTSMRGLNLAIQLNGLDSNEALQHHLQLVNIHLELRSYEPAIQHLLVCKYLITLLGGEHHPELSTVYSLFASIANDCEDYQLAAKCYVLARTRVTDLNKHSTITEQLAEVYLKLGKLDEALYEQRTSYNVIDGIFGKANPKTNDAKDRMEQYRRAVTVRNVTKAKEERELAEKKRLEDATRIASGQTTRSTSGNGSSSGGATESGAHGYRKGGKKSHAGKHKR
jgi:protein TIF31